MMDDGKMEEKGKEDGGIVCSLYFSLCQFNTCRNACTKRQPHAGDDDDG